MGMMDGGRGRRGCSWGPTCGGMEEWGHVVSDARKTIALPVLELSCGSSDHQINLPYHIFSLPRSICEYLCDQHPEIRFLDPLCGCLLAHPHAVLVASYS